MVQSDKLRREVAAMASIERTLTGLPDDATRRRVLTWVRDSYPDGKMTDGNLAAGNTEGQADGA